MPLELGDDTARCRPAFGLIGAAGMVAPHVIRRTTNRALEQVADAFLHDAIHKQTDRILDAFGFEEQIRRKEWATRSGFGSATARIKQAFSRTVASLAQAGAAWHAKRNVRGGHDLNRAVDVTWRTRGIDVQL